MSNKNKKLTALFVAGCVLIVVIAGVIGLGANGAFGNSDKICDGVRISGIDVGGMTKKEAKEKISSYEERLQNRQVTIEVDDQQVVATAAALGFSSDEKNVVDKAFQVGKTGNLLERFQAVKKAKNQKENLKLHYSVDEKVLTEYIEQNCVQYDVKAKNSKLKLVNGVFKATKSRDGRSVQVEDSVTVISHNLLKNVSEEPLTVSAIVKVKKAKYTKKQVSKCKDLLGTYTTYYGSSTRARANNVRTAANYINGTIVYPGKTFSAIKTIKDRTEANGYQSAPEYSSGKVVEGVGGGVCQVSTTLYNAVINAELEIVERSPHSMVVGYVDVSRDAAISGNYKDLKFKNNTKVPVYIAAIADGSNLTFRIYGQETRPANRTFKFKAEKIETIEPGDPQITEDATKPASYKMVTQSAHVGYKAKLWKIVYIDGKRTDKILVNSSSYAAEPEHITVGKQKASPSPSASATPKNSAAPDKAKAKATATPKAKATPKGTKKVTGKKSSKTTKETNEKKR